MAKPSNSPAVEFGRADVAFRDGAGFELALAGIDSPDLSLVIDLYDIDNPVHPEGHLGWWQFTPGIGARQAEGAFHRTERGLEPRIADWPLVTSWMNPQPPAGGRVVLIAVLRSTPTNAIVSLARIPAFADPADLAAFRGRVPRDWNTPRFADAPFVPKRGATVRIVSRSLMQRDAVGELCLDLYRLLTQNSIATELYAAELPLEYSDLVRPEHRLAAEVGPDDTVLYFHSTHDPLLEEVATVRCRRRIAYFHGVTEPRRVQVFDPELAAELEKGRRQVPLLAQFDLLATNSRRNAEVLLRASEVPLDRIHVVPPKLVAADGAATSAAEGTARTNALLHVGRLKGHKRIEDLLALFAEYRKLDPAAECWIVGNGGDRPYREYLDWVEQKQLALPAGSVRWLGSVDAAELARRYGSAAAYVSMSEDEGFCLPVLEAMLAGLPVFAHGLAAVREVLGPTGLVFDDKNFPYLARVLYDLLQDRQRSGRIAEKQRRRALDLAAGMDGSGFLALLGAEVETGEND